jgi:predicted 3-demethylubiquinone-9 3-methyltransferase (glyoxalase superfamily)
MPEITPFLWFDTEGEEAAKFYTSVFPNSKILDVARYGSAGPRPEGMVMTVSFELDGQKARAEQRRRRRPVVATYASSSNDP